ncbi:MAG: hypothetical protein SynsKO_05040 [Synoicihabitans sp.]
MKARLVTALTMVFATVPLVSAVTIDIQWLAGSGNWSTTGNWIPNGLPGVNSNAHIDPLDTLSVTVSVDTTAITSDLTLGANDTISINNARSLTLDAQSSAASLVLNSGSALVLNSAGNATSLIIKNGSVTASGSGKIELTNTSQNRIIGTNNTDVLINQSTLQGAGQLGANTLVLDNQGIVNALYSTPLVIDPSPSTDSTNTGILQALSGGVLQLVNGTIDNTAGLVSAADGGQVQLSGITIKDGTLQTTGTGAIRVTGSSTLSGGVTIDSAAQMRLNNAQTLNVADTLTIDGTLHMDSAGNSTNIVLGSPTTIFDGSGKVSLSNNISNRIFGSTTSNTLVNRITIEGAGQIGANAATVDNQGTITALYGNALTLDPSGSFTNTGTLQAGTGGILKLGAGLFTNTGGQITAAAGSEIEVLSNTTITGGTLTSSGSGFFESRSSATLDGVSLTSGTTFNVPNATNLTLTNTISNAGTISLQSAGNTTDMIIGAAATTLTGGGLIDLSKNVQNRIYGSSTTHHLTNTDNTIRGSGQLGANSLAFTNQGTVEANLSNATLTLDPAATAFVNTGIYRAVNGGILVPANGAFDNTNGLIQAQTGSTVRLSSASVIGGTLDVGPGADLELVSSTFDSGSLNTTTGSSITTTSGGSSLGGAVNLSPGASLDIANNTSLTLPSTGTFTLDGTLTMKSAGNFTDLIIFGGDVTLNGAGKLVLDNNSNNRIYGSAATNRLTLDGVNLEGGGSLGFNVLGITNKSTITANDSTDLLVDPSATGFVNQGTLLADGGTLRLTGGSYDNTGGTIEARAGSTVVFSSSQFTNGVITGPGNLTLSGSNTFTDLTLNPDATLAVANAASATFVNSLQNTGKVRLGSVGNLTDFVVGSSTFSLTGAGEIDLNGNANNRIYGSLGANRLINTDNTIRGSGQLGANQMGLTNQADVLADITGQTLTVDTSSGITNTGLFKAENGGTLKLQSSIFDNQTGGSIESATGSFVQIFGVTLNGGHLTGPGSIRNTSSSSYADLRIDAGTTLDINNATGATFSGTLENSGIININTVGNLTDFVAATGDLTLQGGGEVNLTGLHSRIYGASGPVKLINVDNTLQGGGQIGANQLALDNRGTISANKVGSTLQIDTSHGLTNSGLIQATNGGDLLFNGSVITNQTGGTIHAAAGSNVRFANVTLHDGVVTGAGTIRNALSSTYHDLNLASESLLDIANNTTATMGGIFQNAGTVQLNSVGNSTDLVALSTGLDFTSTGTVHLNNRSANRLYGQNSATTLTNHSAHTISGGGQLGANQLLLQNNGTIDATDTTPLVIDLSSDFTNHGNLKATGAGGLTINDTLINHGDVKIGSGSSLTLPAHAYNQVAGLTELVGGSLQATSFQFDGGDFDGHGTVTGNATFTGAFIAPASPGLAFDSNLTLNSTTTVQIELRGANGSTDYGSLTANSLFIDGMLQVRFGSGFENSILSSDVFTLLSASTSQVGTFANAPGGIRFKTVDGFGTFDVTYNTLSVTLSNFQPVPEPSTWSLFAFGGALIIWRSRRRRS